MSNCLLEAKLLTYVRENRGDGFAERLRHRMDFHFPRRALENRSVLEIGAGPGFLSVFCAASGASRVVALEPQIAGSSNAAQEEFAKMSMSLGLLDLVDYRQDKFEQFAETWGGESFDYILMCEVINHLDEDATTRLHLADSHADRELYLSYFRKLHELLAPGGSLILSDVGRKNFWGFLGSRSFVGKSIDWHIHQQPKVWRKLLAEAGFDSISLRWYTLYSLRKFAFLFARKVPAYFFNSKFVMTARKIGS